MTQLAQRPSVIQNALQVVLATQAAPARIDIYGDIFPAEWGGIDETLIADALQQIGPVAEIDLHVNSRGGSVFTGWAIRNRLAQHAAKKNVFIDGVAASSAATIAMTLGGAIHMPANALVMFHESQMFVMGSKSAVAAQLQQAEKIDEACITLFQQVTGKSEDQIAPLFSDDNETWMNAADAKAFGFPIVEVAALPAPKLADTSSTQSLFAFRHAPATAVALLSTIPDGVPSMSKPTETKPTETTPAPATSATTTAPAPTQAAPSPATESTPAPGGAGVSQTTPTTPDPAPQVVTMTKGDLDALVNNAVTQALAGQAKASETEDIRATCQLAGCSAEQPQSYLDRKFTLAEVRQQLAVQLNGKETPPAQGTGGTPAVADQHTKFREEFRTQQAAHPRAYQGVTEEQFVRTRCKEEGVALPEKKAA